MSNAITKMPSVVSFNRASIVSDGRFFSIMDNGEDRPIPVIRHGIRGTQNVVSSKKGDDQNVSNIQTTESAKTDVDARSFGVEFSIRFLPLRGTLTACSGEGAESLRSQFEEFVDRSADSDGLLEVSCRFARNILNGRWLWRNRTISNDIKISVESSKLSLVDIDALASSLNRFSDYSDAEQSLGAEIAACLAGSTSSVFVVRAVVDMGFTGSLEVYPSQNYVEGKPSGFARPLYKVGDPESILDAGHKVFGFRDVRKMGVAALRDQKIGNAIRTIDTWYPNAELNDNLPISVEPEGANILKMRFFRGKKTNSSAFLLARRMGEMDPSSADGMFMIASLARGGVYSE